MVLVARRMDRLQALAELLRQQHGIEVVVEQVDLSAIESVRSGRILRDACFEPTRLNT